MHSFLHLLTIVFKVLVYDHVFLFRKLCLQHSRFWVCRNVFCIHLQCQEAWIGSLGNKLKVIVFCPSMVFCIVRGNPWWPRVILGNSNFLILSESIWNIMEKNRRVSLQKRRQLSWELSDVALIFWFLQMRRWPDLMSQMYETNCQYIWWFWYTYAYNLPRFGFLIKTYFYGVRRVFGKLWSETMAKK